MTAILCVTTIVETLESFANATKEVKFGGDSGPFVAGKGMSREKCNDETAGMFVNKSAIADSSAHSHSSFLQYAR